MGTSTHGWVEYRHVGPSGDEASGDGWRALVNLQELLGGRAPFGGYLFGFGTETVEPLVPTRGVPSPMSRVARLDYEDSPSDDGSWVSLAELERTDWDAELDLTAVETDADWHRATHRTEKFDMQGRLVDRDADAWAELPRRTLFSLAEDGTEWYNDHVYRVVPKRVRELAAFDWGMLWSWVTDLRDRWELAPENVRIVAWAVENDDRD
ncbi:MAG: hypothetical protein ABEI77_10595 [Halorientalis sp.]